MRDQRDAWDRRDSRDQRQTGGFRAGSDLPGGDFLPGFEESDDDWGRDDRQAGRRGRGRASADNDRVPDGRYLEERFQQDRYPGERGRAVPNDPGRYERDRYDGDRYDQDRYDQDRYDQDQYPDDGQPPRRKRGGARRLAPWIALLVVLALVTPVGLVGWHYYKVIQAKDHPLDYVGAGTGPKVIVQVMSGDTATSLGLTLVTDGVVESQRAFILAAEQSTNTTGLEAGFFEMNRHMKASLAYAYLVNPKNRLQHTVTIPEGLRASDILIRLSKATGIPIAQFQAVLKNPAPLALPPYANGKPEGYLFPATYAIQPHETAVAILQAMTDRFAQEAVSVNLPASVNVPAHGGTVHLTEGQIIIVASLLQAEAGSDADMPKIAEVAYNRLKIGMPLKFDSTVFYGLGKYGTAATVQEYSTPGPYNTYQNKGLPPGPIDSPGDAAIQATLHPATGNLLYFYGCPGGRTIFSPTQSLTKANC
jgi:UPF0755 protein